MKELFIPYNLAVLAKQKGFNGECLNFYGRTTKTLHKKINLCKNYYDENTECSGITAPLYQQIIDWFRKDHDISIEISYQKINIFAGFIIIIDKELYSMEECEIQGDYYKVLNNTIEDAFNLI